MRSRNARPNPFTLRLFDMFLGLAWLEVLFLPPIPSSCFFPRWVRKAQNRPEVHRPCARPLRTICFWLSSPWQSPSWCHLPRAVSPRGSFEWPSKLRGRAFCCGSCCFSIYRSGFLKQDIVEPRLAGSWFCTVLFCSV